VLCWPGACKSVFGLGCVRLCARSDVYRTLPDSDANFCSPASLTPLLLPREQHARHFVGRGDAGNYLADRRLRIGCMLSRLKDGLLLDQRTKSAPRIRERERSSSNSNSRRGRPDILVVALPQLGSARKRNRLPSRLRGDAQAQQTAVFGTYHSLAVVADCAPSLPSTPAQTRRQKGFVDPCCPNAPRLRGVVRVQGAKTRWPSGRVDGDTAVSGSPDLRHSRMMLGSWRTGGRRPERTRPRARSPALVHAPEQMILDGPRSWMFATFGIGDRCRLRKAW
jgi:hypothetical protein